MTNYWLEPILDEIVARYPDGEIVVSSGISPSASYHIGHFREILSANMLKVGLEQRGRQVRHLHVVDNFDPLRKRYEFLPEEYENYVGWPVCLVPDPEGCHDSYAEHFFQEFFVWAEKIISPVEVIRSYEDLYKTGKMVNQIEASVEKVDTIKKIFKTTSNRDLNEQWMPVQLLGDDKQFGSWLYKDIDKSKKIIIATDESGQERELAYDQGTVKLNWRLDWPARWQVLGVMVEPHGFQEHGAAGGSFDTGLQFAKQVFGFDGPLAGFQYGHVHLAGDSIKMSSSKNNIITPEQAFKIMPPEILRYFYARYPGKKRIDFDPKEGLFNMYNEYVEVASAVKQGEDHQFKPAYLLAHTDGDGNQLSTVPFSHLVNVYQASQGLWDQIKKLLISSGYEMQVKEESEAIKNQLEYVKNWLKIYAPDKFKFALLKSVPTVEFSDQQKQFLQSMADAVEQTNIESLDAQFYHSLIHDLSKTHDLSAGQAFKAVYQVLIGKDFGPKAGWFLSTIDRDFLIERFSLGTQT